ncbi:MAG: hypothetical protein PVG49_08505 [Desulfobacteraceae bacterium]|jgi:hypothetical protein
MNTIKQIDLALDDKPGRLFEISKRLDARGITILAFHVAGGNQEGQLSFVVNDPQKAVNLLTTTGYRLETQDVIACEIPDHPGGLSAVLKPLKQAEINIDFIYPCLSTGEHRVLIIGAQPVENALKVLEDEWIRILGEEFYSL